MKLRGISRSRILSYACGVALGLSATLAFAPGVLAGPDTFGVGTGIDGACTINGSANVTRVVNGYGLLASDAYLGFNQLTLSNVTNGLNCNGTNAGGFAGGQLVMLLEMQGGTAVSGDQSTVDLSTSRVGQWELARVLSVAGNVLTLSAPLTKTFDANVTQVIRVREFTTVSLVPTSGGNQANNKTIALAAAPWNGQTGGVLAFLATGSITLGTQTGTNRRGALSADALGFRGGALLNYNPGGDSGCTEMDGNSPLEARKGEGIEPGIYGQTYPSGQGNHFNAAGGGDCHNSGGGGGGSLGQGGNGGYTFDADGDRDVGGRGGAALSYSLLDHAVLGGGGGAGQENNNDGSAGVAGGGIVWVRAGSVVIVEGSSISADGATAADAIDNGVSDGAGGGGAGGVVYFRLTGGATCTAITGSGGIHANGGNGGNTPLASGSLHGPGGGGGGGGIYYQSSTTGCDTALSAVAGTGGLSDGTTNFGSGPSSGTNPGNVGTVGGPGGGTGMTTPPAPVLVNPVNGSSTGATRPPITGTAPANATLNVYLDGLIIGTTTADGTGSYSFTPTFTLLQGSHSVYVTNVVNGIETASNTNTFTLTTTTWASITDMSVAPEGDGARLSWTTDLEIDNLGFRISREDDAGAEQAVAFVPASGASFSTYTILDTPLSAGVHTWWIDDVDLDGTVTRHGPLILDTSPAGAGGSGGSDGAAGGSIAGKNVPAGGALDTRWRDPLDLADVRVLDQDSTGITYEIVPPPLDWMPVTDDDGVTRELLSIDGYTNTNVPGRARLPARVVRVPVPLHQSGVLTILDDEETQIAGLVPSIASASVSNVDGIVPVPVGGALSRAPHAVLQDPGVVAAPVALADAGAMGSQRVLQLVVTPARWDPQADALAVATRLVVHVRYVQAAEAPLRAASAAERAQRRIVSGPSLEVRVATRGLVRVPVATIAAAGIDPALASVYRRGAIVPSSIEGSELVFLGDATPTAWSDTAAYWIASRDPAEAARTIAHAAGAPPTPGATASTVTRTLHAEEDHLFALTSAAGRGTDRWYWAEVMTGGAQTATATFDVPGVAPAGSASIAVRLQGEYDDPDAANEHVVDVSLNGTLLGTATLSAFERKTFAFDVPAGVLLAGSNSLSIANASSAITRVALDCADVTWSAAADAAGGDLVAATVQADGTLTVAGFAAAPVLALDETDPAAPVLLPVSASPDGNGGWLGAITVPAGHAVRVIDAAAASPAAMPHATSDALDVPAGADYVVIAAHPLVDVARGFADFHASAAGGRMRTVTVDAQDVYDEVGFGDPSPEALRRFLELATRDWPSPSPRYVLLAGVSSWDPKGLLGEGVPEGMLPAPRLDTDLLSVASDAWIGTLGTADRLPDLVVGRVPARDAGELATMLAKTLAYESAPRDAATRRATFLADDGALEFDDTAARASALAPVGTAAHRISTASVGAVAARDALLSDAQDGVALAAYVGHGGVQTWGAEPFLSVPDAPTVAPSRAPIVVAADCLNAFDHPTAENLGDALVRSPSGAAAVWTSSAITEDTGHRDMLLAFEHAIWREPGMRLGDAVARGLASVAWREDARDLVGSFALLGDPALKANVNEAPLAKARLVSVDAGGANVSADGSSDADGDALAFHWSVIAAPDGATFHLEGADGMNARLVAAQPGHYRLRVLAADSEVAGPPAEVAIDIGSSGAASGSRASGCDAGGTRGGPVGVALVLLVALAAAMRSGWGQHTPMRDE